jgi:hypothetical protein
MKCSCCNGTGDMPDHVARDIYEATGERPNQRFGCIECDGLGEVEDEK